MKKERGRVEVRSGDGKLFVKKGSPQSLQYVRLIELSQRKFTKSVYHLWIIRHIIIYTWIYATCSCKKIKVKLVDIGFTNCYHYA